MILLTLLIFRFVETSYTPVKELETRQNKSDPVCQLVLDRCGNDPSAGSPTERRVNPKYTNNHILKVCSQSSPVIAFMHRPSSSVTLVSQGTDCLLSLALVKKN